MLGIETKVFYDLSMNEQTSVTTICRNKLLCIRLSPGDCEMDRCNGHSEEAWSAPRNCQGLHKVLEHPLWKLPPTILLQIWVLGVLNVQRGVLWPDQTTSKPGNEKTYLWRQLSPGDKPLSNEQVAQRGYFMLYEDIDLLLKRSKNVPKKSSFLKRDLDARKDSEAYRYLNKESLHHNDTLHINR